MGIPNHLTCLLRNLYEVQEATVRTRHGATDWFSHYVSCFQRITTGGREEQELQRFRANRTKYLQILKRLKNSSEALKFGEG